MTKILVAALAGTLAALPASAAVVYSNNFDAENGGNSQLNYNGFNGLSVTDGTVDLIRSGDFGITCKGGSGSCVDLDGSTNNSGLTSSGSYAFAAGDLVSFSLDWSGNQRNVPPNDGFEIKFNFTSGLVTGTFGSNSTLFGLVDYGAFSTFNGLFLTITNIPPSFAFNDITFFFRANTAGSTTFSLQDFGNDNVGVVVDNLSLDITAVPEPATWATMILGFAAIGAAARRRKPIVTYA